MSQLEYQDLERLFKQLEPQSRLLRVEKLSGGVSAEMRRLEFLKADGDYDSWLLRTYGSESSGQQTQLGKEYRLLRYLHAKDLEVAKPLYCDLSGRFLPKPFLVLEYIDGASEFSPRELPDFCKQLAKQLHRIHQLRDPELAALLSPLLAWTKRPAVLDTSLAEGKIRGVLESLGPIVQRNENCLLHGDFWPGNVLWKDAHIVAVVDWEDAAWGDPLSDVANARLELFWACGFEAMELFSDYYQAISQVQLEHLAYWDLCAALRPAAKLHTWGLDSSTEKTMRERHKVFVTRALKQLA